MTIFFYVVCFNANDTSFKNDKLAIHDSIG